MRVRASERPFTRDQYARRRCQDTPQCTRDAPKSPQDTPGTLVDARRCPRGRQEAPRVLENTYFPIKIIYFCTLGATRPKGAEQPTRTRPERAKTPQGSLQTRQGAPQVPSENPASRPPTPLTAPQRTSHVATRTTRPLHSPKNRPDTPPDPHPRHPAGPCWGL